MIALALFLAVSRPIPTAPIVSGRCVAIDGDTLSCLAGGARVHLRLNAIDAPELPGHCRPGRRCAPGDPFVVKATLAKWVEGRTVRWVPLGLDVYGRTIAQPKAGNRNLVCSLLRARLVVYKPRWDNFRAARTACPRFAK